MTKVCVVTVCRNAITGLKLTVASVCAQRYENIHYVIVDGASTDGTLEFLDSAECVDEWISEPDLGIYDAMNKAIALCPADAWVIFLNAGDRFYDDAVLQRIAARLTPNKSTVACL